MPVSVVCDSAVNAAIRESIASSDEQAIQSKLVASTKRVLLTKIEFEEVNNYSQSVLESLKSKYIVLKPSPNERKSNYPGLEDKEASGQTSQTKDPNQLPSPKRVLFPRENVQIGWKSSGRKWLVGAGMINVGNTCYLNSTLQALFHVPAIANWLISDSGHRDKCEDESSGSQGGCIICAMANTLVQSQTNQLAFKPYQVYTKLRLVCKHLIMGRQEDAHEFLRYLVEAMEKAYLQRFRNSKELDQFSKETTPLNQILGGYLKSAVRCLACGHVSTTFQHFEDLLLDIRKANTIEEALDGYFARERLEDMGYKCESCKKKVSATKQFSLERAPISLCIQLKRFSMMGTKLNKHVAIRPRLDLTPYAAKKNTEQLVYKLVSMVTHLGASQHCGHYTAIGLTEAGGYYQFDDSCVRPISMQNVINTNAYIIFYELEDNLQHHRQTSTQVSRDYVDHTTKEVNNSTKLHNGQNGDSEGQQRYMATSTNNSNSSLLGINSKLNNKIEYNGGTSSTSSLSAASSSSSTAAGGTFIGPQLPSKTSSSSLNFEQNNSRNVSNSEYSSADAIQNGLVTSSSSPSKLVNSPNKMFKLNASNNGNTALTSKSSSTFQSPNQKTNQNLDSKLVIHVKNGNTNSLIGTSPKNITSNINNTNSNSNSNGNGSNHNGKYGDGMKFLTTSNSPAKSLTDGENFHLRNGEVKKSTLPSMPKLGSPASPTPSTSNRRPQTPTSNGSHSLQNGFSKSSSINEKLTPVKSLVPYESDDDSNNSEGALQIVESPEHRPTKEHRHHSSHTRSTKFDRTYDSDDSCWSSDSDNCRIKEKQTPPSPPVVKSKTGLWQVTNACINLPSSSSSSPSIATPSAPPPPDRKNPFATLSTISSSNFYSNGGLNKLDKEKKFNGNKSNSDPALNKGNEVVDSLLKLSHRGYGAPVLSWNGQKPHVEKEISDEKRQNRKRELDKDEENEMDRGRQKKIKIHGPVGRDNPGYSPFQEYQNQYNSQQRRWNNGNSNGRYYNGHIYRQNPYQNRNYNNFRRHRFQNRRNGNSGGFHHRRDS